MRAAILILLAGAAISRGAPTARAQTAVLPPNESAGLASVDHWSAVYGVSAACELAIIDREDPTWNPYQYNLEGSGAFGDAQFMPDGVWLVTPLGRAGVSIYDTDGDQQIEMMSWALAQGYGPGSVGWQTETLPTCGG